MKIRELEMVEVLRRNGISYSGAWQVARAQQLTGAQDRQKLLHILELHFSVGALPQGNDALRSARGIVLSLEGDQA